MSTNPSLTRILADILDDRFPEPELSGGLMFQFKEPDAEKSTYRLFCYRKGDIPPSTIEYGMVRRVLEKLLPGQKITLDSQQFYYRARDGINRIGRVFSWQPMVAKQASLLDVGKTAVSGGYE